MDSAALIDARHSWHHTHRFGDATYLGLLSHTYPQRRLTAAVIVLVTAQIHQGVGSRLRPICLPACSPIRDPHACVEDHLVFIAGSTSTSENRGKVAMEVTDSERDMFSSK